MCQHGKLPSMSRRWRVDLWLGMPQQAQRHVRVCRHQRQEPFSANSFLRRWVPCCQERSCSCSPVWGAHKFFLWAGFLAWSYEMTALIIVRRCTFIINRKLIRISQTNTIELVNMQMRRNFPAWKINQRLCSIMKVLNLFRKIYSKIIAKIYKFQWIFQK